jgi:hypothetical protein
VLIRTIGFHVKINVALMILKRLPDKVSAAFLFFKKREAIEYFN